MSKNARVTSEEGFASTADIREHSVHIDPAGEAAPDTLETLVADYAACYVPAMRVGAEQRGVGDLGRIDNDVTGEINENDKLESIRFEISVDAELDAEAAQKVVDRAFELCKVHDALKQQLHATVTLNGHTV